MRTRGIREGSVGLLILVGVILFGGLVLWLRGIRPGSRNYTMTVTFEDANGMQIGTPVRYRGYPVGEVENIRTNTNEVEVLLKINQPELKIPEDDIRVAINQSGFIGESTVDITPSKELTEAELALSPTGNDCDSDIIICDGDRLDGITGVSYESLLRSAETLADTFSDPVLIADLQQLLDNVIVLTEQSTELADNLAQLTETAEQEIRPISDSLQRATDNASEAAQEIQLTATDVRNLLEANRFNLTATLDNIGRASDRVARLADTIGAEIEGTEFLENLEILSANAAEASINFRDASVDVQELTGSINQPENVLLIQQTLESARDVFQSAQKVLSDVDEVTGDPAVRDNLRNLIYGLQDLLSNAETLEQQAEITFALSSLASTMPLNFPALAPAPRTPASSAQP